MSGSCGSVPWSTSDQTDRPSRAALSERSWPPPWLEGHRDEAAALIPGEFVLQANLLGTEQMVRERLRTYRNAVSRRLVRRS